MYILASGTSGGSLVVMDSTTDTVLWNIKDPQKRYSYPIDITYNLSNEKMYVLNSDGILYTVSK